jgi:hypothetical protein
MKTHGLAFQEIMIRVRRLIKKDSCYYSPSNFSILFALTVVPESRITKREEKSGETKLDVYDLAGSKGEGGEERRRV